MCHIIRSLPCLLLDVQNTQKYIHNLLCNQCHQSHKIESTFKNTNMFEGQLQLAQSKTLSASTNLKWPETQSWDTFLMYINPPTFISINPSVLVYFSFQLGWCKLLWLGRTVCLKSVPVWLSASPVSFALVAWMGGMYRKIEPGARRANGCIPPSDIYLHCLSPFPSLVLSLSRSLFLFCHWALHILWLVLIFLFLISHTSQHTTVIFHFCFQSLCLQLYSVSPITFPLSSTPACTVTDSVIHRI